MDRGSNSSDDEDEPDTPSSQAPPVSHKPKALVKDVAAAHTKPPQMKAPPRPIPRVHAKSLPDPPGTDAIICDAKGLPTMRMPIPSANKSDGSGGDGDPSNSSSDNKTLSPTGSEDEGGDRNEDSAEGEGEGAGEDKDDSGERVADHDDDNGGDNDGSDGDDNDDGNDNADGNNATQSDDEWVPPPPSAFLRKVPDEVELDSSDVIDVDDSKDRPHHQHRTPFSSITTAEPTSSGGPSLSFRKCPSFAIYLYSHSYY